jgi:hypothetical protein
MLQDDSNPGVWVEERDWLVETVELTGDTHQDTRTLQWIGLLYAISVYNSTRFLAMSDDGMTYELWFSFDTDIHMKDFLDMIREDGYADPYGAGAFSPPISHSDLARLRRWKDLFPADQYQIIETVGLINLERLDYGEYGPT